MSVIAALKGQAVSAVPRWLPIGVLIMAAGVASLGLAVGGPWLAALSLAGLAFMPDPARFGLNNGFLDSAWLLETHPGAPYSLGVAGGALAALVRWRRDQRLATLILAGLLTAGCSLVRVNTFVWLAPVVGFGMTAGWQRLSARQRVALSVLALIAMIGFLFAVSWQELRPWRTKFMVEYGEIVHLAAESTALPGLYPALDAHLGLVGAGLIGVGLTIFGTAGPWLPALLGLAALAAARRRLNASDWLPFFMIAMAAIAIVLAPVAQNGDLSEYRHRPGALLVVVAVVWTLRFGALAFAAEGGRVVGRGAALAIAGLACLSLVVQAATIGAAKRPHFAWAANFYSGRTPLDLIAIARFLPTAAEARPRFAVVNPADDKLYEDDGSRLVALSGVPTYVSYSVFLAQACASERNGVLS